VDERHGERRSELRTQLSRVDGGGGALRYRGHPVADVARHGRLEDALAVLWDDRVPGEAGPDPALGEARAWAVEQLPALGRALDAPAGMDALRGSVAQLSDPTPLQLVAAVGVFGAAWVAARRGRTLPAVDPAASHGADLLRLALGDADATHGHAFGTYLCTVADHGTNASSFAARVVASTGSDDVSAVVAALGALKGPLHGGAPGPVLDMLDAIEEPSRAEAWIRDELNAGRRIMGMGHRVYRARDPRAAVLEAAARSLDPGEGRLALARAVEEEAQRQLAQHHPERVLRANVEFATAVLLEALGWPREAFTVAFAMGRVVGWLAHVEEQRATGRLIRPRARYVGRATAA